MYNDFAAFYAEGGWPRFSAQMVRMLPPVLERFGLWPGRILDLACGEGTFAVAMARRGLRVTGIDQSAQMLEIARARAAAGEVSVRFRQQDLRSLRLRGRYDLVTCWFDSLNYLLEAGHLVQAFSGVYRLLAEDGLFVFDMNTIHGLAVEWVREPCYVHVDSGRSYLVSIPRYDAATKVARLHITGFRREGRTWVRMDEEHQERGYPLAEIRRCLKEAGLREVACWASLDRMDRPKRNTPRVWFVARKATRRPGWPPGGGAC